MGIARVLKSKGKKNSVPKIYICLILLSLVGDELISLNNASTFSVKPVTLRLFPQMPTEYTEFIPPELLPCSDVITQRYIFSLKKIIFFEDRNPIFVSQNLEQQWYLVSKEN